jgi:cytochrome c oxidase subunit 1
VLANSYHRADNRDVVLVVGYAFMTLGWLAGLGVLNDIMRQIVGRPVQPQEDIASVARYFRYTLDHKVVGIQYLISMIAYFCVAGLFAIAIRAELLSPTHHLFSSSAYIAVVGEHGTMMMMLMGLIIVGPFGNYLLPLMIGSKKVAFPRMGALSFWLTPVAFIVLLSALLIGGFDFGWTGYPTLSIQDTAGADSYAFAFGLMGISMTLAAFNIIMTVICYRAPGMRRSRLPIFVWGMVTTSFMFLVATPFLVVGMYMILTDRTIPTAFFADNHGGSVYLHEDLFWFFGHPEEYILALPALAVVSEIIPVFCRKPLFGYKLTASAMIFVVALSFFGWQSHLFVSGINPDWRPLFIASTAVISVPTGAIYLAALGTFWKAKIRLTVPMLFALGLYFNFLVGGVSGVFLSDAPADTTEEGSLFVTAHFHYAIMGGLIFGFMAATYYWLPKIMGIRLNHTLGKLNFWTTFVFVNSSFLPMFAIGMSGQPQRVFEYAKNLQTLNDWVSISSFFLGGSILIFLINFIWSTLFARQREHGNPWRSRGLEWQTSSPPPSDNLHDVPVVLSGPYEYGTPGAPPVADLNPPSGVVSAAYAREGHVARRLT